MDYQWETGTKKGGQNLLPVGVMVCFWKKNVAKKHENVTWGGVFGERKKNIFGVSLMNF